jgi:hypothetical protein
MALRSQDPDGLWRLDLGAPDEVRNRLWFDDPRENDGDDDRHFGEDS